MNLGNKTISFVKMMTIHGWRKWEIIYQIGIDEDDSVNKMNKNKLFKCLFIKKFSIMLFI